MTIIQHRPLYFHLLSGAILMGILWLGLPSLAMANPKSTASEASKTAPEDDNVSGLITILEDDKKRQEVIKLLKLMEVLNAKGKAPELEQDLTAQQVETKLDSWMDIISKAIKEELFVSQEDLDLAKSKINGVIEALRNPQTRELWQPYALKSFLWSLAGLLIIIIAIGKFGVLPPLCHEDSFWYRAKAVAKYIMFVVAPTVALIITVWSLPPPSVNTVGITRDAITGFSFIHSVLNYFFMNIAVAYILIKTAKMLFIKDPSSDCAIISIHPVLSRHFLRSFRNATIYIAFYIFVKETILEYFAVKPLYSLSLAALVLPVPIYFTYRTLRLKHLVNTIKEAEDSAGDLDITNPDTGETIMSELDYRANIILREHWALISIVSIWILGLISIFNPADIADKFTTRLISSLGVVILATLIIKAERSLALRLISHNTDNGHKFLMNIDNLINTLTWIAMVITVLTIWGLPLGALMRDATILDVLGRIVTIIIIGTVLLIFLRFSNLTAEWLMSFPEVNHNRNWRTMAPLLLTSIRAMAIFVSLVVVLERLGVNIGPILAGAGILGLGVGMGAQSLVKDIINGISILLSDILAVGDYVAISGHSGTVESVGLRNIRLRDTSNNLMVVPNSSVTTIINMTREYSQDLVEFTAPYDADPDDMIALAREVAEGLSGDANWKHLLTAPVSLVGVVSFDSNGTTIRLRVHSVPGQQWVVGRELRLRLKRTMMQKGLKSPWFGQNVFMFKGDTNYANPANPEAAKDTPKDSIATVDRL